MAFQKFGTPVEQEEAFELKELPKESSKEISEEVKEAK
jgi:hypothetical protein